MEELVRGQVIKVQSGHEAKLADIHYTPVKVTSKNKPNK